MNKGTCDSLDANLDQVVRARMNLFCTEIGFEFGFEFGFESCFECLLACACAANRVLVCDTHARARAQVAGADCHALWSSETEQKVRVLSDCFAPFCCILVWNLQFVLYVMCVRACVMHMCIHTL